MPRPRVKDEARRRVARACETCKRRKEKCDGALPCLLCRRRGREGECSFADDVKSRARKSSSFSSSLSSAPLPAPNTHGRRMDADESGNPIRSLELGDALATASPAGTSKDAEIAIESLLTLSGGNRSTAKTPRVGAGASPEDAASHAPVPKLARLLRDGHGKFIFVGDSSNLAFLQQIRRLAKTAIGECGLTTDPLRHAMIEAIPVEKPSTPNSHGGRVMPTVPEARELTNQYLLASSGVLDLFDSTDIVQHLCAWAADPAAETDFNSSIYFLVLALGAQNSPAGCEKAAELYFSRGRELVVSSFMDDPSVLTIQSYALIALYMLTTCRRNGAFMLLGIAIRAAYALGLHRSDISKLFEPRERRTRERVWKSLRMLDLFMSASLGRPPATSEVDGGNVSWEGTSRDYEDIRMGGLNTSAMLRICFIFERILNEVYCRREVSVQLVESISRQYRDWTLQLPTGLQTDGLADQPGTSPPSMQQTIGLAHLKGSYYWSIILLTRPFLVFRVSSMLKSRADHEDNSKGSETSTLSEACIDAALRSIEIATDLVHLPGIPKRLVLVTNSTIISALVVGVAILGDFDRTFPLLSSLEQAKQVLAILAKHDPSARRYMQITGYLHEAAFEHIKRRDKKQLQKRRQDIHSIFGDLLNKEPAMFARSEPWPPSDGDASLEPSMNGVQEEVQDMPWPHRLEELPLSRGPVLTTSGMLASSVKEPQTYTMDPNAMTFDEPDAINTFSPSESGVPMFSSYVEEFPLFSLLTDLDQLSDPFASGMV